MVSGQHKREHKREHKKNPDSVHFKYKPRNQNNYQSKNMNYKEDYKEDYEPISNLNRPTYQDNFNDPFSMNDDASDAINFRNPRQRSSVQDQGMSPMSKISKYANLDPNLALDSTNIKDLDMLEDKDVIINQDNIFVDPISDPLFLPTFNSTTQKKVSTKQQKSFSEMSLSEFLQNIAMSYIDILNDILQGNCKSINDLLLKDTRGIAVALLLIIISVFFVFFNQIEIN